MYGSIRFKLFLTKYGHFYQSHWSDFYNPFTKTIHSVGNFIDLHWSLNESLN